MGAVSIMVEHCGDGWCVVAYLDDVAVQRSPPIDDHEEAMIKAKAVAKEFESKVAQRRGYRPTYKS